MIYVYAETESNAHAFVDRMDFPSDAKVRIFGNESKTLEGMLYRDTDTIFILPGVSREKISNINRTLAKLRAKPVVNELLVKHYVEKQL